MLRISWTEHIFKENSPSQANNEHKLIEIVEIRTILYFGHIPSTNKYWSQNGEEIRPKQKRNILNKEYRVWTGMNVEFLIRAAELEKFCRSY